MNLILVLNRDAGTLRSVEPDVAAEELAAIFRAHGHDVAVELHEGGAAVQAVRRLCREGKADALIVGGGDGTVSGAAAAAAECGATIGILPLGTMNLFARSLGIPLEMKAAAEALATGEPVSVDIGEVNGRFFVHLVALGLHAEVVRARERMTYASRYGKIGASFRAWWMVVRAPPRLDAEIRTGGTRFRRRTAAILVSNNLLGEGHLPYADDPSEGALGLYIVRSRRLLDLVTLAVRLLFGAIARNPQLEQWRAKEIEIALPEARVKASVDGEAVSLETPLHCRSRKDGLRVLRPKPQSKEP